MFSRRKPLKRATCRISSSDAQQLPGTAYCCSFIFFIIIIFFVVLPCSLPSRWCSPRTLATLLRMRHPNVPFCFFVFCDLWIFVTFCFDFFLFFFSPSSLACFWSLVSFLAHPLEIGLLVSFAFFFSSVPVPSCCLVFRLVLSCRPSVGQLDIS